jgi:hypothetical protein
MIYPPVYVFRLILHSLGPEPEIMCFRFHMLISCPNWKELQNRSLFTPAGVRTLTRDLINVYSVTQEAGVRYLRTDQKAEV